MGSTMKTELELKVVREGDAVRLLSPGVGLFTEAVVKGAVLVPGQRAGYLVTLGRARALVVPPGVSGVVTGERPEAVRAPVGYGTVLYELEGLDALGSASVAGDAAAQGDDGLVFASPQTGRFWHRQSPAEPPLIEAGMELSSGQAIGLIEVMKTFTQVTYKPTGALPERARVVRVAAGDGVEIAQGAPLFEVEAL